MVEVAAKRLRSRQSPSDIPVKKNTKLRPDGRPSQRAECQRYLEKTNLVAGGFMTQYSKSSNNNKQQQQRGKIKKLVRNIVALGDNFALVCLLALSHPWSTRMYCCIYFGAFRRANCRLFCCACGTFVDTGAVAIGACFVPSCCAQKQHRVIRKNSKEK